MSFLTTFTLVLLQLISLSYGQTCNYLYTGVTDEYDELDEGHMTLATDTCYKITEDVAYKYSGYYSGSYDDTHYYSSKMICERKSDGGYNVTQYTYFGSSGCSQYAADSWEKVESYDCDTSDNCYCGSSSNSQCIVGTRENLFDPSCPLTSTYVNIIETNLENSIWATTVSNFRYSMEWIRYLSIDPDICVSLDADEGEFRSVSYECIEGSTFDYIKASYYNNTKCNGTSYSSLNIPETPETCYNGSKTIEIFCDGNVPSTSSNNKSQGSRLSENAIVGMIIFSGFYVILSMLS